MGYWMSYLGFISVILLCSTWKLSTCSCMPAFLSMKWRSIGYKSQTSSNSNLSEINRNITVIFDRYNTSAHVDLLSNLKDEIMSAWSDYNASVRFIHSNHFDLFEDDSAALVSVYHITKLDRINPQNIMRSIQRSIDFSNYSIFPGYIFLLYNTSDGVTRSQVSSIIDELTAYSMNSPINIKSLGYDSTSYADALKSLKSINPLAYNTNNSFRDHNVIRQSSNFLKLSRNNIANSVKHNRSEKLISSDAVVEASYIVDIFIQHLTIKLSDSYPLDNPKTNISLLAKQSLFTMIEQVGEQLPHLNLTLSPANRYIIMTQLRNRLHSLLQPYYIQSVSMTKKTILDDFNSKLKKIAGKSKNFIELQRKLVSDSISQFAKQLEIIKTDYLNVLKNKGKGLLAVIPSLKNSTALPSDLEIKYRGIGDMLRIDYTVKSLRDYLNDIVDERTRQMILQGSYNPYLRNQPFPPTHVNLNYMFDFRNFLTMIEYRSLYDDHFDGVEVNRAYPLKIKDVSRTRFLPDEGPAAKQTSLAETMYRSFSYIYS